MLDHVGLLGKGNQEMARFAWKAFAQWQERQDNTPEEAKKKKQMFEFMQAFRETFSRPVRRIRFLGLFDTGTYLRLKSPFLLLYEPSRIPSTVKPRPIVYMRLQGTSDMSVI